MTIEGVGSDRGIRQSTRRLLSWSVFRSCLGPMAEVSIVRDGVYGLPADPGALGCYVATAGCDNPRYWKIRSRCMRQ